MRRTENRRGRQNRQLLPPRQRRLEGIHENGCALPGRNRLKAFRYAGKTFATALCGDLWTDGRPEEMNALNADVVLWPVWCDYTADEWNASARHEYAAQAALCGRNVLLVNPYCADPNAESRAAGAAACFRSGSIQTDRLAGSPGTLLVQVD